MKSQIYCFFSCITLFENCDLANHPSLSVHRNRMTQSYIIGLGSIVVAIYNLILAFSHIKIKHTVVKRVSKASYAASILLFFSVLFITMSYYFPIIGGYCLCKIFFSTALSLYILAIFLMKFMYLMRIKVFNEQPLLSMNIYIIIYHQYIQVQTSTHLSLQIHRAPTR